ncbi:MAG: sugar ABC transporter substrate-binding protein [Bacillota bacterium]
MQFKKVFIVLVLVLGMVLGVAGCAGDSEDDGESVDPRTAYAGTTLRVLLKTGYETEAITRYVSEFEEATGIKVEHEVYDEPTLRNKFILDSTAGTGSYDVVATQFWYMPEYLRAGWLEPLDAYEADEEWYALDHIPEGLLKTFRDQEGSLFALPVSASGGVLIYRTDLLEKYGLEAPETTEDVLRLAAELKGKESEVYPFVGRGDSSSASFGTTVGWAWAYGARVMDEELNVTVDTPEMKKAMDDFVALMSEYAPEDQASIGWDVMSEMFRQGNAAMNFEMSGFPSVYANPEISSVAGNIGVVLLKGPAGHHAQWMYGEGLGISKNSKNKEAAWLFLQWRTSLAVALQEVAEGIRLDFPDARVYESEVYAEKSQGLEFFTELIPDILASVDTAYWPPVAEFDQVAEAFQKEISLAIAGDQTVEAALAKAQAEIEKIVAGIK